MSNSTTEDLRHLSNAIDAEDLRHLSNAIDAWISRTPSWCQFWEEIQQDFEEGQTFNRKHVMLIAMTAWKHAENVFIEERLDDLTAMVVERAKMRMDKQ